MSVPTKRRTQQQHTVRFRTPNEGHVIAIMAATAGVSVSEWIATAARNRMREWLENGWGDAVLSPAMNNGIKDTLKQEQASDEAGDVSYALSNMQSEEAP